MSATEQAEPRNGTVQAMKVIRYERSPIKYPRVLDVRIPTKPEAELRPAGLFGWGVNRQDADHEWRLREIEYIGKETDLAERMAIALEVRAIKAVGDGIRRAEELVYELPPETVARAVTEDMAGETATRCRARHGRLAENLDCEMLNILHRK